MLRGSVRSPGVKLGVLASLGAVAWLAAPAALSASPWTTAAPAEGADEMAEVRALPSVGRLSFAGTRPEGLSLSAGAGYGYTESIVAQGDRHHRSRAQLAATYAVSPHLGFSAAFDARYDQHRGDGIDAAGYVGNPRLAARAAGLAVGDVRLGAEAMLWLPGDDAPSLVPGAASLELRGLAEYAPPAWGTVAAYGNAGVRHDRSAASAPEAHRLGEAQRMALGVSDSDALVAGAGLRAAAASATVFAEWSWDLLIGSEAPAPSESPMRLGLGAYAPLGERYGWFGAAEISLSSRPSLAADEPLVPVEPRLGVLAGVTYHFGSAGGEGAPTEPQPSGSIAGEVETWDGQPARDAVIRVGVGDRAATAETDDRGAFEVDDLPTGSAIVTVTAPGHREESVRAEVRAGHTEELAVELTHEGSSEIKGVVLSYQGEPIRAAIEIEPLEIELRAGREGRFQTEVPPGDYRISISAPGHRNQVRSITVEEKGVTVLNVDLMEER